MRRGGAGINPFGGPDDALATKGLKLPAGHPWHRYNSNALWKGLQEASCYDDVVQEGEILYYPSKWWHATDNIEDDVIGAVGRHINENNFVQVFAELRAKCESESRYESRPDKETCAVLATDCLPLFERVSAETRRGGDAGAVASTFVKQ
jgi:hypothetical protein